MGDNNWTYLRDIARNLKKVAVELRIQNELQGVHLSGLDHEEVTNELDERRHEIEEEWGA